MHGLTNTYGKLQRGAGGVEFPRFSDQVVRQPSKQAQENEIYEDKVSAIYTSDPKACEEGGEVYNFVKEQIEKGNQHALKKYNFLGAVCEKGIEEFAEYLIDNKLFVDKVDEHGNTPLHLAIDGGHLNIVKKLCAARANLDKRNKKRKTPFEHAVDSEYQEIAKFILEMSQNKPNNLHVPAMQKNKKDMLCYLNKSEKTGNQCAKAILDWLSEETSDSASSSPSSISTNYRNNNSGV